MNFNFKCKKNVYYQNRLLELPEISSWLPPSALDSQMLRNDPGAISISKTKCPKQEKKEVQNFLENLKDNSGRTNELQKIKAKQISFSMLWHHK